VVKTARSRNVTIKLISAIYLAMGIGGLIYMLGLPGELRSLEVLISIVGSAPMILAGAGAFLNQRWPRYFAYPVSALFLVAVPIGTLIGGYMLYNLWQTRYTSAAPNNSLQRTH